MHHNITHTVILITVMLHKHYKMLMNNPANISWSKVEDPVQCAPSILSSCLAWRGPDHVTLGWRLAGSRVLFGPLCQPPPSARFLLIYCLYLFKDKGNNEGVKHIHHSAANWIFIQALSVFSIRACLYENSILFTIICTSKNWKFLLHCH